MPFPHPQFIAEGVPFLHLKCPKVKTQGTVRGTLAATYKPTVQKISKMSRFMYWFNKNNFVNLEAHNRAQDPKLECTVPTSAFLLNH